MNELKAKGLTNDEIEEELASQDTGIKSISAVKKDSKVIATLKIKNELMRQVASIKGASIEVKAPVSSIREGVVHQGKTIGFVLTNSPSNPDALRV